MHSPFDNFAIFFLSTSKHKTSWPAIAKQTAVTSPTYPVPITDIFFWLSLLIFFLVISCVPVKTGKNINFSKDLTFEEFKSNLKVYVDNSDYPNIDE